MSASALSRMMRFAALLALGLGTASCTTVVKGFNETFEVKTMPPGATVTTTLPDRKGRKTFCTVTPCEIDVSRKESFVARVEKEGYHPVRVVVRSSEFIRAEIDDERSMAAHAEAIGFKGTDVAQLASTAGFAAGALGANNIFDYLNTVFNSNFGLIGFYAGPIVSGVDSSTGSHLNLYPNPVSLVLIPEDVDVPEAYRIRRTPGDTALLTTGTLNAGTAPSDIPETTTP